MARKEHRFRLDRDTGVTIYGIPHHAAGLRLEPDHFYTTDDPEEVAYLQASSDFTEIKIPKDQK